MAMNTMRPCGDFRASYRADQTIFATRLTFLCVVAGIAVLACAPLVLDTYYLSLMIQIGYLGIAALGLNILVGFSGQISIGHAVFFGFGGFASAYLAEHGVPVPIAIVLAGLWTTAVGLLFGIPAARVKGLYLAIATLAAQFILQDFFVRAEWFTGGTHGAMAAPFEIFGYDLSGDKKYFYVVLVFVVVMYLFRHEPDAHPRRAGAHRRARPLSLGRDDGREPHQIPHHGVRHLVLLCRHRRGALCPLYRLHVGGGAGHPPVHPVPRHDHHRRAGLDHGLAARHHLHGAAAGTDAGAGQRPAGQRHRPRRCTSRTV